jgi:dihydroneopterin aldolase/2-amino-4-hydroxy-6-hydroxymethyldihydropteridine diphosphokinase/dihydropteroate synthase/2-amino-4-hydroxy-6-hydroxymethyldihydropteridine diphosphokinase/dihydropteroate synthase
MGILNVTPDSFSDGGKLSTTELAVKHAKELCDVTSKKKVKLILDIGGESTRPGAEPVAADEELSRVLPVIQAIRCDADTSISHNAIISIDTFKADVARKAIEAGANIINDVTAGNPDADVTAMSQLAAEKRVPFMMMHSRGNPKTMKELAVYPDGIPVIQVVADELNRSIEKALTLGVYPWQIITDPGISFAKNTNHNLDILKDLHLWSSLVGHFPILIGASRKGFIGSITHQPEGSSFVIPLIFGCLDTNLMILIAEKRVFGTAATVTSAIASGATFVRVHDVAEACDVVLVSDAIYRPDTRV